MKPIFDINIRWYDDTTMETENRRELTEQFLKALGITSDVACDILEVMLIAKGKDITLTTENIKKEILNARKKRGMKDVKKGLTDRNIQIWMRYFREIKLIDRMGSRYVFTGNKSPSTAFRENTKPLIDDGVEYIEQVLEKLEEKYGIKKK